MIHRYIHHLKQKPEHHRKRIAFGASVGLTLVIVFFWFVGISSGLLATPERLADSESSGPSLFGSLKNAFGEFGSSISEQTANVKSAIEAVGK